MLPKISVIVPVYNVENYVSKCIESIINQTYSNLEIIIVDDGSTDKSGEICEYYAKRDDRIVLVHQENQGLSMARNNALDIAKGEYIGFVDSDDWIAPDMYEVLYNSAVQCGADISVCNFYCMDKAGEFVLDFYGRYIFKDNDSIIKSVLENDDKMTHYFDYDPYGVVVWNKLYDKKLFDGIRYPCNKMFEDTFTTHKLMDKANKVTVSPECKYYYLWRSDGLTKKCFTPVQLERIEASIDRYDYISAKHPKFENICRKHIFSDLLYCAYKAFEDGVIAENREEIETSVKKVKVYSTDECDLSKNEKLLLRLLFDDIGKYVTGIKIYHKNRQHNRMNTEQQNK